jgi:hypothetical protein
VQSTYDRRVKIADETADLPPPLISEQERGGVVFLCGAGVSQRVGLPSFDRLTRQIYARLNERWEPHPAEMDAMEPRAGQAKALDRALFALAKRLGGHDPAARARVERQIMAAVEAELAPPEIDLSSHRDIARLSRDAEMRSRVVTTNFDTLFERAWPLGQAPSRAGADLPPPLTTDFAGVLHLHGRIQDADLQLPRTPLVLNSAEFGEAYLRSGWAARYVYDLTRATTIVIVGYGADDPPMRYILEVLTADRERYPDLKPIYAFAPCAPDSPARVRETAIWDAKGTIPILYDSTRADDHDALYRTLSAWADYADDPLAWRRAQADRVLALEPDVVGEEDWDRLRWLLRGGNASALLAEINPHPRWAGPLGKAGLLSGDDASPGQWVLQRFEDPGMPSNLLDGVPLEPRTVAMIEHGLHYRGRAEGILPPHFRKAWQLIVDTVAEPRDRSRRWHEATRAIAGDAPLSARRAIVAGLRPRAWPERPFHWPGIGRDPASAPRLRDLLHIDFGPQQIYRLDDFVAALPAVHRRRMVQALCNALDDALEDAIEYEFISEGRDGASGDVRSVARHEQDRHPSGFYPIVRAIIDLWSLVAAEDRDWGRAVAATWRESEYLLHRRMWLHALSTPAFNAVDVAAGLAAISDRDFWLSHARRESMRLMAERWAELDGDARTGIEGRIADGIPATLLAMADPGQARSFIDHEIFMRLHRIRGAGHTLGEEAIRKLRDIEAQHPNWIAGEGDRDDFGVWSTGVATYGPQGAVDLLEDVEPDRLVKRASEISDEDPMRQGEVWRLFCAADPHRALTGLLTALEAGDADLMAWRSFLWAVAESEDVEVHAATLAAVERPDFPRGLAHPVLDWLMRRRSLVPVETEGLLSLWDRLFDELTELASPVSEDMREDPVFRMLNEAEGKVGTLLLNEIERRRAADEPPLCDGLRQRIERLVASNGALGLLGRAAMMDGVRSLFRLDADWTTATLVPLLKWDEPTSAAACWAVLLYSGPPEARLFALLKTDMLSAARRPSIGRESRKLASWLMLPLLWAQRPNGEVYDLAPIETRRALADGGEDLRRSAAFLLVGAMEQLGEDKAAIWRERVQPLIATAWPHEPELREEGSSHHLVRAVLLAGDAFPEAVEAVAPLLAKFAAWDVAMWLEFDDEGMHRFDQHPASMLKLLEAVIDETAPPTELEPMLRRIAAASVGIEADPVFRKLLRWAR